MEAMKQMTDEEYTRTTDAVRRFLVEKSTSEMSQTDYDAQYARLCSERTEVEHKLATLVEAGDMANVRPREFLKALSFDADAL